MSTIMLKFVVRLEDSCEDILANHGPLFHRWLPDGTKDGIVLNSGDPDAKLTVWFVRFGASSIGQIRFSYSERDVDPKIIPTQAVLEGGPLFGSLEIQGLSEEEIASIRDDKKGSKEYEKLGRRIVKKIIYPPTHRFIETLRTNYGQYWLRSLNDWDSRKESLGSYCSNLQLKCSIDGGATWKKFEPDKNVQTITLTITDDFSNYLTETDWKELSKIVQDYEPSIASHSLSRAQQSADQENLKYAFIEGVSALELSINEFVKKNIGADSPLVKEMAPFWDLPLKSQLLTVAAISGKIPMARIENAIDAIKIRNEIVHEGTTPHPGAEKKLRDLLNVTAALLSGPKFRFVSAQPGNLVQPIEEWEKRAK